MIHCNHSHKETEKSVKKTTHLNGNTTVLTVSKMEFEFLKI